MGGCCWGAVSWRHICRECVVLMIWLPMAAILSIIFGGEDGEGKEKEMCVKKVPGEVQEQAAPALVGRANRSRG